MSPLLRLSVICFAGFLLCMGAIFCGCASSALGRGLNVAVAGSGVADLVTTQAALERGGVEANPAMRHSAAGRWLLKGLGVGTVIAGAHLYEIKGHPAIAQVIRAVTIGLWTTTAVLNTRVHR